MAAFECISSNVYDSNVRSNNSQHKIAFSPGHNLCFESFQHLKMCDLMPMLPCMESIERPVFILVGQFVCVCWHSTQNTRWLHFRYGWHLSYRFLEKKWNWKKNWRKISKIVAGMEVVMNSGVMLLQYRHINWPCWVLSFHRGLLTWSWKNKKARESRLLTRRIHISMISIVAIAISGWGKEIGV